MSVKPNQKQEFKPCYFSSRIIQEAMLRFPKEDERSWVPLRCFAVYKSLDASPKVLADNTVDRCNLLMLKGAED